MKDLTARCLGCGALISPTVIGGRSLAEALAKHLSAAPGCVVAYGDASQLVVVNPVTRQLAIGPTLYARTAANRVGTWLVRGVSAAGELDTFGAFTSAAAAEEFIAARVAGLRTPRRLDRGEKSAPCEINETLIGPGTIARIRRLLRLGVSPRDIRERFDGAIEAMAAEEAGAVRRAFVSGDIEEDEKAERIAQLLAAVDE